MAEARNFKFGTQLGFAKAHHKTTHPEEKWAWPWEAPIYLGFPLNISATAALFSALPELLVRILPTALHSRDLMPTDGLDNN